MERSGEVLVSRLSFFSEEKYYFLFVISINDTNSISTLWTQKDPTDFEMKHSHLKIKNQEHRRVHGVTDT